MPRKLCGSKQHKPRPPRPAAWKPAPQEEYVAYWSTEPGWNTQVEIRNNIAWRDLTVTPVLRISDGAEIPLPPVTVASNEVKDVDLRQALPLVAPQLVDSPNAYGSVVLRYSSNDAANAFASTIVSRPGTPIAYHFDGDDGSLPDTPGSIESIWWLPAKTATDYLLLSNGSRKPNEVFLTLSDLSGRTYRQNLLVGAGQTLRVDVRALLLTGRLSGPEGGVTIDIASKRGSIEAAHIVFDDTTGLTATMKTFDKDDSEAPKDHTVRAPMMALATPDPVLSFPDGTTLVPQIFLRNTTAAQLDASITVNWRAGAASGNYVLPIQSLAPAQVRVLNLSDFIKPGQIPPEAQWSTVSISYKGRDGDLIPIATSFDPTFRYGLQSPFSDFVSFLWSGSMWHVDAERNTLITTGNAGTEATHAAMTLFFNGGKDSYTIEKLLQPGEQIWTDVGQLIHTQLPDKDGHVIPPSVMSGTYQLRDLDHITIGHLYEGKLVLDKTYGHGYYGCAICDGYRGPSFDASTLSGAVNTNAWAFASSDDCTLTNQDVTADGYSWYSNNSSIATHGASVGFVAAGSTTGGASFLLPNCGWRLGCPEQESSPAQTLQTVTITSISPTAAMVGSTGVQITIHGSGFGTSPTVNLPSGFSVASQSGGGSQVIVNVNIPSSVNIGVGKISVRTTDGVTSNSVDFTADGPYFLVVNSDIFVPNDDGNGNGARYLNYQVKNFSGTNVSTSIPIGETNLSDTGWNCSSPSSPPTSLGHTACGHGTTRSDGTFTDGWGIGGATITPVGCGFSSDKGTWNWCDGSTFTHELVVINGWIHTNAVNELGVTNPPSSITPGTPEPH